MMEKLGLAQTICRSFTPASEAWLSGSEAMSADGA